MKLIFNVLMYHIANYRLLYFKICESSLVRFVALKKNNNNVGNLMMLCIKKKNNEKYFFLIIFLVSSDNIYQLFMVDVSNVAK